MVMLRSGWSSTSRLACCSFGRGNVVRFQMWPFPAKKPASTRSSFSPWHWVQHCLAVCVVFLSVLDTAMAVVDGRLRFGVYIHQDRSCYVYGLMFDDTTSLPMLLSNAQFFKEPVVAEKAQGDCIYQANNIAVLYGGNAIMTLSRIIAQDNSKFRFQVGHMKDIGHSEIKVTEVYTPRTQKETRARFYVGRCFSDLLAFLEDGTLAYKRFYVPSDTMGTVGQGAGLLEVNPSIYAAADILRVVHDENSGELILVYRRPNGHIKNKVEVSSLYNLNSHGKFVQVAFEPQYLLSASSIDGYRYFFVSPKHPTFDSGSSDVKLGAESAHLHTIYRGVASSSVVDTVVTPGEDEESKGVDAYFDFEALQDTQNLHMHLRKEYLEANVHGFKFKEFGEYYKMCGDPHRFLSSCKVNVETLNSYTTVAIVLVVLTTLMFLCLVSSLASITVFCVKERKRIRMRRKQRRMLAKAGKLGEKGGKTGGKSTMTKGGKSTLTKKGMKTSTSKIGKDGQYILPPKDEGTTSKIGTFFADQMRRIAAMEDDDDLKGPGKNDVSNYVSAKSHFNPSDLKSKVKGVKDDKKDKKDKDKDKKGKGKKDAKGKGKGKKTTATKTSKNSKVSKGSKVKPA